jgi:hypothetical protein
VVEFFAASRLQCSITSNSGFASGRFNGSDRNSEGIIEKSSSIEETPIEASISAISSFV